MKNGICLIFVLITAAVFVGCGVGTSVQRDNRNEMQIDLKPGTPIAVMPFETDNALSNLGGHLSDEIIAELLERAPHLRIIPGTIVRNYLQTVGLAPSGILDEHAIHNMKDSLRCRYLLTGNLYTSIGDVRYTQTYTTRIASGSVTVRLVDCDSMFVVWAKHVESNYSTSTYYYVGSPQTAQSPYLTDGELIQGLLRNLAQDVAREFRAEQ